MRKPDIGKIASKLRISNFSLIACFFQSIVFSWQSRNVENCYFIVLKKCSYHFEHLMVDIMIWLRVTKYLCHIRRRRICYICCTTNIILLFASMINYRIVDDSKEKMALSLVEHVLLTLPGHWCALTVFVPVVAQPIAFCVLLSRQCVSLHS